MVTYCLVFTVVTAEFPPYKTFRTLITTIKCLKRLPLTNMLVEADSRSFLKGQQQQQKNPLAIHSKSEQISRVRNNGRTRTFKIMGRIDRTRFVHTRAFYRHVVISSPKAFSSILKRAESLSITFIRPLLKPKVINAFTLRLLHGGAAT